MEQRKLALDLLKMQHKLDKFWNSLLNIGLEPGESILSEVDLITIIVDLYGITDEVEEDAIRFKWSRIRKRLNAPQQMMKILDKRC